MSNNDDIIISSKKYSKYLIEYFLLKLQHVYTLSVLITISVYFFMYRSGEKIPQDYLIVFIVLVIIGVVFSLFAGIHHWLKNGDRKKDLENNFADADDQKSDLIETWLKRSQFIIVSVFFLATSIICIIKLNASTFPSSMSYGLAIPSLFIFLYTLFVFVWSFYYTSERSFKVGIKSQVLKPKKATDIAQNSSTNIF